MKRHVSEIQYRILHDIHELETVAFKLHAKINNIEYYFVKIVYNMLRGLTRYAINLYTADV